MVPQVLRVQTEGRARSTKGSRRLAGRHHQFSLRHAWGASPIATEGRVNDSVNITCGVSCGEVGGGLPRSFCDDNLEALLAVAQALLKRLTPPTTTEHNLRGINQLGGRGAAAGHDAAAAVVDHPNLEGPTAASAPHGHAFRRAVTGNDGERVGIRPTAVGALGIHGFRISPDERVRLG